MKLHKQFSINGPVLEVSPQWGQVSREGDPLYPASHWRSGKPWATVRRGREIWGNGVAVGCLEWCQWTWRLRGTGLAAGRVAGGPTPVSSSVSTTSVTPLPHSDPSRRLSLQIPVLWSVSPVAGEVDSSAPTVAWRLLPVRAAGREEATEGDGTAGARGQDSPLQKRRKTLKPPIAHAPPALVTLGWTALLC